MAGGAETPNIAAVAAIARLGACESARGPDADRHVKLLIQWAVEGSLPGVYLQSFCRRTRPWLLPSRQRSQRRSRGLCSFGGPIKAQSQRSSSKGRRTESPAFRRQLQAWSITASDWACCEKLVSAFAE